MPCPIWYIKTTLFALFVGKSIQYSVSSAAGRKTYWTWKIINLLVVIYSSLLAFALLITANDRSTVLRFISSTFAGTAGKPLPEKDYGDVCTIYVPDHVSGDPFFNITDRLDIFVVAHSLGWFVKTLVLRDVKTAWICSILFEIIELCFAHLLQNFNECWWDSVIMDVFGCNMIGIHAADLVLNGFMKFNFFDRATVAYKRRGVANYRAMFAVCLLTILISLIDLNFFFLKYIFYFPTTHFVCFLRTILWVLISIPGAMELNKWTLDNKMSFWECRSCVIGCFGLATEILFYTMLRGDSFARSPATPLPTFLLIVTLVYATLWSAKRGALSS